MESLVHSLKDFFIQLENPILQALVGGLFTWGLTAMGAGLVFFFKSTNRKTKTYGNAISRRFRT